MKDHAAKTILRLYEAARHAFILSESYHAAGEYRVVCLFRDPDHSRQFYAALTECEGLALEILAENEAYGDD